MSPFQYGEGAPPGFASIERPERVPVLRSVSRILVTVHCTVDTGHCTVDTVQWTPVMAETRQTGDEQN